MTTIPTAAISVGGRRYVGLHVGVALGPARSVGHQLQSARVLRRQRADLADHGSTPVDQRRRWHRPVPDGRVHPGPRLHVHVRHSEWTRGSGPRGTRQREPDARREGMALLGGRRWSKSEADAVPVVDAHVSELSVRHDTGSGLWQMVYLEDSDIVLRTSTSPPVRGRTGRSPSLSPTTPPCTAASSTRGPPAVTCTWRSPSGSRTTPTSCTYPWTTRAGSWHPIWSATRDSNARAPRPWLRHGPAAAPVVSTTTTRSPSPARTTAGCGRPPAGTACTRTSPSNRTRTT